jgi:hypothetical protein
MRSRAVADETDPPAGHPPAGHPPAPDRPPPVGVS